MPIITDKYIPRKITKSIIEMSKWYPVVSVNGPRQSGKSTLLRHIFPDYEYINLEDKNTRTRALEDPVGFINNNPRKLIIDEAQYVPDLFSQIQVSVDDLDETGQYIISGSQNFLLLRNIKQSLAGRVGMVKLLPLSYSEIKEVNPEFTIEDMLFTGGYPGLYHKSIPTKNFFSNYINTYALRDITEYINPGNISDFKRFLKVCAQTSGKLINLTKIGDIIDVSRQTCKHWLSYLKTSFICFELEPYANNKIKSLTKTPKLYFHDTGLLVNLLGIKSKEMLLNSDYLGPVVENFVIAETVKKYWMELEEPELYFYRDNDKLEADLIDFTDPLNVVMSEIKSSHTYHSKYFKALKKISEKVPALAKNYQVVMQTDQSFNSKEGKVLSVQDYLRQN